MGGGIILGRIILPLVGFETEVLMNVPFGITTNLIGGILMGIQKRFWIWVLIYTIISWCVASYLIWVIY